MSEKQTVLKQMFIVILLIYFMNLYISPRILTVFKFSRTRIFVEEIEEEKYLIAEKNKSVFETERRWFWSPENLTNETDQRIGVTSAFYHPVPGEIILVTLFSLKLARSITNKEWNFGYSCIYYDENQALVGFSIARIFTRYIVYCQMTDVLKQNIPKYVYLMRNDEAFFKEKAIYQPSWLIPVTNLGEQKQKLEGKPISMSLCHKPLDPTFDTLLFLQFIEYYRSQGAQHFYIPTVGERSIQTEKIINYYTDLGILESPKWEAVPFCHNHQGITGGKCYQMPEITHCMLKNTYVHNYVMIIDYDEFIKPARDDLTVLDIVKYFDKRPDIGHFRFQGRYRLTKDIRHKTDISKYTKKMVQNNLPILHWKNTSDPIGFRHNSKSIIKPENVKRMLVHYVQDLYYGKSVNNTIFIKPKTAVFLHFKNETSWDKKNEYHNDKNYKIIEPYHFFNDSFMNDLVDKVSKVIREVFRN